MRTKDGRQPQRHTLKQTKETMHNKASTIYTEEGIKIGNIQNTPLEKFDEKRDGVRLEPEKETTHNDISLMCAEEVMKLKSTYITPKGEHN